MNRFLPVYSVLYVLFVGAQISLAGFSPFANTDSIQYIVAYDTPFLSTDPLKGTIQDPSVEAAIVAGKKLSVIGTIVHFSGFIMSAAAMPYTVNEIRLRRDDPTIPFPGTGLALSLGGFVLSNVGALSSCAGTGKIEEALEDADINFRRNKYWNFYARSLVFETVGWGLYVLGSLLLKNTDGDTGPIILMAGLFAIELGAETYRSIAAAGPIAYSKDAHQHLMRLRSLKIDIQPHFTFDGSAGCRCRVLF